MEAVLSWVPRSGARGWGLEVSVQSKEHCQWGAVRGWGEGGGLSGACPRALPQGPWRVTCTPLSVPSGGKRVGWGFLCPHSPGSVAAPGVRGLNPPPLKGDPHGAMGASLVKGRGHEPRTAALTGQGSTSANRGEPGRHPGGYPEGSIPARPPWRGGHSGGGRCAERGRKPHQRSLDGELTQGPVSCSL